MKAVWRPTHEQTEFRQLPALRHRYRKLLRAAIAETVGNEADLDDEMRYLVAVLRRR